MFPSAVLGDAVRFAELLATDGVVRGLIGPREAPRLWERHLLNSAVLAEVLPEGSSVCDIGSGAGLPGLVIAIARRDLQVTLVEPLLRRTTFLSEIVADLALDHVEIVRGRADALHGKRVFDVVTSRAVAPLGRLLDWSMPLVAPTGALMAMKGQSVDTEIGEAKVQLARFGCAPPEILLLGEGVVSPPTTVLRVAWADPARVGLPNSFVRATGRASRRRSTHAGRRPNRPSRRDG